MSTSLDIQLTVRVVEPLSYMAKALAQFEKELGLLISEEAISQMESNLGKSLKAILSLL